MLTRPGLLSTVQSHVFSMFSVKILNPPRFDPRSGSKMCATVMCAARRSGAESPGAALCRASLNTWIKSAEANFWWNIVHLVYWQIHGSFMFFLGQCPMSCRRKLVLKNAGAGFDAGSALLDTPVRFPPHRVKGCGWKKMRTVYIGVVLFGHLLKNLLGILEKTLASLLEFF